MPDSLSKKLNPEVDNLDANNSLKGLKDWNIIIASNRGPIENIEDTDGNILQQKGSGGLITGLSGAIKTIDATWISCPQTQQDVEFDEGYLWKNLGI